MSQAPRVTSWAGKASTLVPRGIDTCRSVNGGARLGGMVVYRLKKDEARRIAIHAQLLDAPRSADLVDVVDRLTLLQIDPTAAIAPSAVITPGDRRYGALAHPVHSERESVSMARSTKTTFRTGINFEI